MDLVAIFELFVLGVVFVGGIICNMLVIRGTYLITYKRTPSLHNGKNVFINLLIINLAVADLLTLVISMPIDVITEYISWPFGEFVCKYVSPAQDMAIMVSTLSFAAIGVERYIVTKGTISRRVRSGKRFVFGIWFASWLTIGLPAAIYRKVITDDDREECDIVWPNIYVGRFFLFYDFILVSGCAVIGAMAYCCIRRNLYRIQRLCIAERANVVTHDRKCVDSFVKQSLKVSTMLFVLIVLFVICTFPFLIFAVLVELGALDNFDHIYVVYLATSCLLYGNSLANPAAVLMMSRECRTALSWKRTGSRKNVSNRVVLPRV